MQDWLTTTIPGIVILGAVGSIVAVAALKALEFAVRKVLPYPYRLGRQRGYRMGYILGFSVARIENDKSRTLLITKMAFHVGRQILFLSIFLFSVIAALLIVIAIPGTIQNGIGPVCFAVSFMLLHLVYVEYSTLRRIYLHFWNGILREAEEHYKEDRGRAGEEAAPEGGGVLPRTGA